MKRANDRGSVRESMYSYWMEKNLVTFNLMNKKDVLLSRTLNCVKSSLMEAWQLYLNFV